MSRWWEPQPDDPPGFAVWIRSITNFEPTDPGEVESASRRWLAVFFEHQGPVAAVEVRQAFQAHQADVAAGAIAAVQSDLDRTSSECVRLGVRREESGAVRIAVDGGCCADPVWSIEPSNVLVQVAADVQEFVRGVIVDGHHRCWPECRKHDAGLHAVLHDGRAVWWCRRGQHEVAPIGKLASQAGE